MVQDAPLVAEVPAARRSLAGTLLLAVVALLGVVALLETGTAPAPVVVGLASANFKRHPATLPAASPQLRDRVSPGPQMYAPLTEEQAKQQWLASLDAPAWGQAASAMSEVYADPNIAYLDDDCAAGDPAACEALRREEEAKQAWLARQDVPLGTLTEEQAKQRWLARQEAPAWSPRGPAEPQYPAPAEPEHPAPDVAAAQQRAADEAWLAEAKAKAAWLAKQDVPSWGRPMTEEAAKAAWLAKQDAPTWGQGPAQPLYSAPAEETRDPAPEVPRMTEEEAKAQWLAKQAEPYSNPDVLSWGQANEERAKQQWLAKQQEKPKWR